MVNLLYEINIHVFDFFKGGKGPYPRSPFRHVHVDYLREKRIGFGKKKRLSQPLPAISLINFNGIKKSLPDGYTS